MKNVLLSSILMLAGVIGLAQNGEVINSNYTNAADNLLLSDHKLVVGGYGEVHYNQPLNDRQRSNGKLDIHRMVMLFGYNFNAKTQFVSEIEFEHVKEVYVEQAFLQHKLNDFVNFRAGLMLVPMGIINEYHEPTTFNGVERPVIDTYLSPSTWREIGFGLYGNILPISLKYQLYMMNGFNGYDGSANLNGKYGLRKGRQKGAESFISTPTFSGKIEYYGIRGLNMGLSGYIGETQSTLYNGLDKTDDLGVAIADSSVVGVAMVGLDARYSFKGLQMRGQFYYASLANTDQYNVFTAESSNELNDLGSAMLGYYAEIAYNVLRYSNRELQLLPFLRYEYLNTHQGVGKDIDLNPLYQKRIITTGVTLALVNGAVLKSDIQFIKDAAGNEWSKTISAGIGVMF